MAMGIFEGHMAHMADGFKAVRMAEIELNGGYNKEKTREFFTYFDWKKFNDEEFHLCPPVVSHRRRRRDVRHRLPEPLAHDDVGQADQGADPRYAGLFEHRRPGLHLRLHRPGFGHGAVRQGAQGKEEIRKEITLIGMAHRTTYVAQGSISNVTHLIESFIEGINSRRPALFNIYALCMPEHGIADDRACAEQARGGIARLSAVPLQPRRGHHLQRRRRSRRQSVARIRLADLLARIYRRRRRQGAAPRSAASPSPTSP